MRFPWIIFWIAVAAVMAGGVIASLPREAGAGEDNRVIPMVLQPTSYIVYCGPVLVFEKHIKEKLEEAPVFVGRPASNAPSVILLTLGANGSYTIYFRDREAACMLASGSGGELIDAQPVARKGDPS